MPRLPALLLTLSLAAGCKKPVEAPETLAELAGFLFAHMMDEEPEELNAGVENLVTWLQNNPDATIEGYTVSDLDPATIESVTPDRDSELGSVGGASVGAEIFEKVDDIAEALVVHEQEDIFDQYIVHDRTFVEGDADCFLDHDEDCVTVTTDNHVESKFAGLVKVTTESRAQFRFVELEEGGYAFLHRTWLMKPTETSVATVYDQLYFGMTFPWNGHSFRLGTTWMNAKILGGVISEDEAMKQMIKTMSEEAGVIDEYLD